MAEVPSPDDSTRRPPPDAPARPADPFDDVDRSLDAGLDALDRLEKDLAADGWDLSDRDRGFVAEWEADVGRVTGVMSVVAAVGIVASLNFGLPVVVLSTSVALLLVAILLNRIGHWLDEGGGTVRGAIARRAADVWETSLGSFWGVMSFVRFVQLEVTTLVGEYTAAGGLGDFLRGEFWEVLLGFSLQSIQNTIAAAIWPVNLILDYQLWGIAALVVGAKVWDLIHAAVDARLGRTPDRAIAGGDDQSAAPSDDPTSSGQT